MILTTGLMEFGVLRRVRFEVFALRNPHPKRLCARQISNFDLQPESTFHCLQFSRKWELHSLHFSLKLQGILATDSQASAVSLCLLVYSQPDSRPPESTLNTPINNTSSMILHSEPISFLKRKTRWIIVNFEFSLVISYSIDLISADVATSTWHDAGRRFTKSIFGDTNLLLFSQHSRKPVVSPEPGNIRFWQPPGFTF